MKNFFAMVKARSMEFVRDRGTFFWNLLFPIILVFGFSLAFSNSQDTLFKVGILGEPRVETAFQGIEQIDFIEYDRDEDYEDLLRKLRMHQLDMLLDFNQQEYYINEQSQNAQILRMLWQQNGAGQLNLTEQQVQGDPIRYVDWVVPGIIGMNMLFSCLFGVGYVIVRYRNKGVLKRMKATPVTALEFIGAQMASRFIIVMVTSMVVFTGTNIFLKFLMLGSYWNLILLTALAILCMISLGLVFAARFKSEELASGILNLLTFPMIIFSGLFFSLEGTPDFVQKAAKIFPLTHFINAAREVMLEGAGLVQILPEMAVLGGMTLVFLLISAALFRWE